MAGLLSRLLGGVDKFSGEVLNPTSSLGKLGAYLGAASGGTLGQAALGYQSDERRQQDDMLTQQLRLMQLTKPQAPHYWETNNGSLAVVGQDGKPQILYQDPTPKIDWITATNPDGTKTLTPTIGGIPQGMGQPQGALTAPVGKLTPIDGGSGASPSSFPRSVRGPR